ncbi:PREDICTED: U-box domain-containing protein 36 [Tarenaya hassleriana]|uniref:U-box domain-containing protein 36 n=1 Tax=Tarenaya hassleriana TaxID=28532 RepID=UPI00053C77F6|nr:PREDICTED: U-box domain-containing protein 36 [Tarenaya hassleriana]
MYQNSEIEEEEGGGGGKRLDSVRENQVEGSSSSGTVSMNGEASVYIGVGKGESSMEALRWTLGHFTPTSNTFIFLIHVFPETHFIPYPLGRLPREQASQEQLESFMSQEKAKRRSLLHKFLDVCSASKVDVETILVESDSVAKAIQDLIPILNIRKLVLGINKSNARKLRSRRGSSVPEQILRSSAAETCEVKVICEGNEMKIDGTMIQSPTKSPGSRDSKSDLSGKKDQVGEPFACICFRNKAQE